MNKQMVGSQYKFWTTKRAKWNSITKVKHLKWKTHWTLLTADRNIKGRVGKDCSTWIEINNIWRSVIFIQYEE